MRKLLLSTAAAIMLAGPALAGTKMLTVNFSGVIKSAPKIGTQSTIVPAGVGALIAVGNRVDFYNLSVTPPAIVPALTVTAPVGTIIDMVFTPPSFLTVQGGGPFAVTIDYSVSPPFIFPAVAL